MNYRKEVLRTALRPDEDYAVIQTRFTPAKITLTNAAMGLAGEAGEFADLVKKIMFHGKTIGDVHEKMVKELGDIRWYLELAAYALCVDMEEIERLNIEKLRARFPEGFTEAAAEARVDVRQTEPTFQDPCENEVCKVLKPHRHILGGISFNPIDPNAVDFIGRNPFEVRVEVPGTGKTMDELRRDNTSGCSCCTDDGFYYECDEHKKGGAV